MRGEEASLVERLRGGDADAFAAVVREWSPAMLRAARVYVRSDASAQDVVQEAWLAVIRGLPGFEGRASLRTWSHRILVNIARRRGGAEARTVASLDGHDAPALDPARFRGDEDRYAGHWRQGATPADWGPESAVLAGELRHVLATALAGLPERQRAVVELRDVHGLDASEVCMLLDLTPANQRVLLHRGRSRLRAALEEAHP
ncbi:MAG: RNA polymerase sigma factor [Acidimicrobiales bacterium]